MNLNKYIVKLRKDELTYKEYDHLKVQGLRIVIKACNRYNIHEVLSNPVVKQDVYGQVYLDSLMKSLEGYDTSRGSFSTYFFYKACSGARNEVGKLKRRYKVLNTYELKELI